jgi:hypothetical protein
MDRMSTTQADILKFPGVPVTPRHQLRLLARLHGDSCTGSSSIIRLGPPEIGTPSSIYLTLTNGDGQFAQQQVVEGVTMTDENRLFDLQSSSTPQSPSRATNTNTLMLLPYLDWANASDRARPSFRQMNFQLSNLTGIGGDTTLASVVYQDSKMNAAGTGLWGSKFISPCGLEQGAPTFSQEVFAAATGIQSDDSVLAPTWWW